jgi:hypothetical protein
MLKLPVFPLSNIQFPRSQIPDLQRAATQIQKLAWGVADRRDQEAK